MNYSMKSIAKLTASYWISRFVDSHGSVSETGSVPETGASAQTANVGNPKNKCCRITSGVGHLHFRVVDLVKDPVAVGSLTRSTTANPNSYLAQTTSAKTANAFGTSLLLVCLVTFAFPGLLKNARAQAPSQNSSVSDSALPDVNASYEGFSKAYSDVLISTEEVGELIEVPVKLGQLVREGDLLAQLDDSMERAAVEVSEVQAAMQGELQAAKANRSLQAYRVEQLKELRQSRMAGEEELRRAEMELAVADARLQIVVEQNKLRRVELKRLQLQVERRQLRAPFDALVAEKRLDAGAAVTPSSSILMRLIRIDSLIGTFNVPAEKSFAMKPGIATQVYFRAARQTVNAVIDAIAPSINGESGTVQVQVRIENPDGTLRPGDRCSMRIAPQQQITRRPKTIQH